MDGNISFPGINNSTNIGKSIFNNSKCNTSVLDEDRKILALDLDNTLIYSSTREPYIYDFSFDMKLQNDSIKVYVQKRPFVDLFLSKILQMFDVYIFTASIAKYAKEVVSRLIPSLPTDKVISKERCKYFNGQLIKELSLFGRDFSKIMIVDDQPVSYSLNPYNGIRIHPFTGQLNDNILIQKMLPLLVECHKSNDVRIPIQKFSKGGLI